jgi:hypothetical protein
MTTVAAAEGMGVQEVLLGLKLHESTTKYIDPGTHLAPMFREVVGTMLDLMMHYEDVFEKIISASIANDVFKELLKKNQWILHLICGQKSFTIWLLHIRRTGKENSDT